jgi:hypothetical protein
MKLFGLTNGKIVVASISHYDYVMEDGVMMDGGQPHTNHYAGYNRYSGGRHVVFEVPQTFAELYEDYNLNKSRKYGIWNIEDVKILEPSEYPDPKDPKWKIENAIWGTRGKSGEEPLHYIHLKDATTTHLAAILSTERISPELKEIINQILKTK